jgi:uncharacterized membrane protein
MIYNLNDVSVWIIILGAASGFFLCFLRLCDWWKDRSGPDPIDHWRMKRK